MLDKLLRLEHEALFTEHWSWGLQHDLATWRAQCEAGALSTREVPRLAAALRRFGIDDRPARRRGQVRRWRTGGRRPR